MATIPQMSSFTIIYVSQSTFVESFVILASTISDIIFQISFRHIGCKMATFQMYFLRKLRFILNHMAKCYVCKMCRTYNSHPKTAIFDPYMATFPKCMISPLSTVQPKHSTQFRVSIISGSILEFSPTLG